MHSEISKGIAWRLSIDMTMDENSRLPPCLLGHYLFVKIGDPHYEDPRLVPEQ